VDDEVEEKEVKKESKAAGDRAAKDPSTAEDEVDESWGPDWLG